MSIKSNIKSKINAIVLRTKWYDSMFPDCKKFWNQNEFNLDLVNLGSSSAKAAFDYTGHILKAANWAMQPQSFVGDYAVITNYCSFLKPRATVILSICPFSSLGGGNEMLDDKYYSILRPISIPYYSMKRRDAIFDMKNKPLHYFPLISLISEFIPHKTSENMSSNDMERDAERWIADWKKEFSLYKLQNPFALINRDRFADSIAALSKLIDFCLSHEYKTFLVLPPMSSHLSSKFNEETKKRFISDLVEKANKNRIPFLNYMENKEFLDDRLYRNAYMLNKHGAKLFTSKILKDIK